MGKEVIAAVVIFLLVLPLLVAAQSEDDHWYSSFLDNLFGSKENIAGSASCSGFWNCLLGRENLAGGADG